MAITYENSGFVQGDASVGTATISGFSTGSNTGRAIAGIVLCHYSGQTVSGVTFNGVACTLGTLNTSGYRPFIPFYVDSTIYGGELPSSGDIVSTASFAGDWGYTKILAAAYSGVSAAANPATAQDAFTTDQMKITNTTASGRRVVTLGMTNSSASVTAHGSETVRAQATPSALIIVRTFVGDAASSGSSLESWYDTSGTSVWFLVGVDLAGTAPTTTAGNLASGKLTNGIFFDGLKG